MIPVVCKAAKCGFRFQSEAAALLSTGTCPRCASEDLDFDDEVGGQREASSVIEEANQPFAPSTIVQSRSEVARCSTCFTEFEYQAADPTAPVPACPECGSVATTPAGATGVAAKRAAIANDILRSNPGMSRHAAMLVAHETIRRYPRVLGRH